ncbi:MAG: glutathione S-transferase [Alphaproteobacteria bacterium]|nr:glutathione S-transferase [Alphaproteobacteria bacterium]
MALKLCGFSLSNYYSKLKLQLLEKGVPFEEELVWVGNTHPKLVGRSPMAKVPFIETEQGALSESFACAEYIEQRWPAHPLLPSDPFAAAKVREMILYLELHIELVARELYSEAFFAGKVSDETKDKVRRLLTKGLASFKTLARFEPFVAGPEFGLADCAAAIHLPLAASACRKVLDEDLVAAAFPDLGAYMVLINARPTMQRVNADRKQNAAEMAALRAPKPV